MPQITGTNRHQLQILSLDELIAADHQVRVIEAFVDVLDLEALGFVVKRKSYEGRPAFGAEVLLKLYLYGYQNRVRSSRRLAHQCVCNLELWWWLNRQQPCYKVIADFRKDNRKFLRVAFRQFNLMCKDWDLFGGETVAVDSSKFRTQNSKNANSNKNKVERHLKYIDDRTAAYFEELQMMDESEAGSERSLELETKWDILLERRKKYEALATQLEEQEAERDLQISTSDPDARALPLHMGIVEVGYNVQTSVDAANNWYKKNNTGGRKPYRVKVYKLPFHVCNACPVKLGCSGAANLKNSKGRPIERTEYDDYITANRKRVASRKEYYRQRQAIVEHPFGTIKRNWGYTYTLATTKQKVDGEFGLIFLSYNLRRAMSILGNLELISRLKRLILVFLRMWRW